MIKRFLSVITAATGVVLFLAQPALAASNGNSSAPAGGAAIGQVVGATLGAMVVTGLMLAIVAGHRTGRITHLQRLAAFSERVSGVGGFAALPGAILGVSLLTAVFGMYWDISIHIDKGRDPGPLANPAHYFILVGLFGVFFAGVLACAIPLKKPSAYSVRLPNGWDVPLGGILITFCGAVSLLAFPLDDIWHRLFGQDVTLWGPTHLLLIGGASFSILGQWILYVEGQQATGQRRSLNLGARVRELTLGGALLVGLSTFQAEFDFGVPQFRLAWAPLLIMLAAGMALVSARVRLGPGGALLTLGFFVLIRGGLFLIIGPILGHSEPHFPLYLVEALVVEGVALVVPVRRTLSYSLWSGLGIGTIGLAAEWGWSHVWAHNPWPSSLFPEGAILGFLAAIAGSLLGGLIGRALLHDHELAPVPRWVFPAAASTVIALAAWTLPMPNGDNVPKANVQLTTVKPGPQRKVLVTVHLQPPNAADNARWFTVTGWQGGGRSVVNSLKKVGPGVWRSTQPLPVYGQWKATLRLQRGRAVLGMPIYFPEDKAIPAPGIHAADNFTRPFVRDKKLLQREQKPGTSGALWGVAYVVVGVIWFAMLGAIAWGLARIDKMRGRPTPPVEREREPSLVGREPTPV